MRSVSGSCIYSSYIELQFLECLVLTFVFNLLPANIFVAFRLSHPDDATMEDAKKALRDNNIDFNQLKGWNFDRCRNVSVEGWTRDEYQIGLVVEGIQCTVLCFDGCLCEWRHSVHKHNKLGYKQLLWPINPSDPWTHHLCLALCRPYLQTVQHFCLPTKLLHFERTFLEMCGSNPEVKVHRATSNIVTTMMLCQRAVKGVHSWKSSLHLIST